MNLGDELLGPTSKKSSRTITKVGAIKKMLKKNILPNTKITFGDEGEILNSLKVILRFYFVNKII